MGVCVAAVMGPYLASGLRTEQLAFYGSAAFLVVTQRSSLVRVLAPVRWLLLVWLAYAGVAVVGGLVPVHNATPWESGSLLAGLDNALLPLATMLTVAYWCSQYSMERILAVASSVLVVAMATNAVVALAGSLVGLESMPVLRRFWAADGTSSYVAELAEQMGRYSGVFNQPAEAGIAYTLAALSLAYLQKRGLVSLWMASLAWGLLVVGGLLTLSKVFLGGLLLALALVLLYRARAVWTTAVALATVVAMVGASLAGWFNSWGASTMASWYRGSIDAGDSPLYTLTAGRFGTPGSDGPPSIPVPVPVAPAGGDAGVAGAETEVTPVGMGSLMRTVAEEHPVFGLGARGLQVAYDSAWAEAMVVGGLVGLAMVLLAHLLIAGSVVVRLRRLDSIHALLLAAVVVLTLAGSMGMPALTGNRESTLLWIWIIVLGFAGRLENPKTQSGTESAAVAAPENGRQMDTSRATPSSGSAHPG